MEIVTKTVRAPEIYGDFWFNSEPLPLSALRGQVILIDFWDYTSIGCLRAIPYVSEWHRRYRNRGLVVIGVHTPEFAFARNPGAVERALKRLGIEYPVVTDNEYLIWKAFSNRLWATKYIIDRDGYIRYIYPSEGNYTDIERAIQALVVEAGFRGELPLLMEPIRETDRPGVVCYRATPAIYTGYTRGSIGNVEGFNLKSTIEYADPKIYVDGHFYLHGRWFIERDYLRYDGSPGTEGYVLIPYHALEVYAVISPEDEPHFKFSLYQDDLPLTPETKGEDVVVDESGRSFVTVDEGRLYSLVKNREFGEHTLKLVTDSASFAIYGFSFVSSAITQVVVRERL